MNKKQMPISQARVLRDKVRQTVKTINRKLRRLQRANACAGPRTPVQKKLI
jgi:hypothetical protein